MVKLLIAAIYFCYKDLALNKPATQSSTFVSTEPPKLKTDAKLAVDGDMAIQLTEGSCAQTAKQVDPWWKVDLLREYVITDVSVVSPAGRECSSH